MTLSKTRKATGNAARLAGLIFIAPIPLAFIVGMFIGATTRNVDSLRGTLTLIEAGIVIGALILGLVIAYTSKPAEAMPQ